MLMGISLKFILDNRCISETVVTYFCHFHHGGGEVPVLFRKTPGMKLWDSLSKSTYPSPTLQIVVFPKTGQEVNVCYFIIMQIILF